MAYSAIDIGTSDNDGTGDNLVTAMTKTNANDIDIETNIDALATTRASEETNIAFSDTGNIYTFPNGQTEYQTISGSSVELDFSVEKPHNFYLPHGRDIYLLKPVGLTAGVYPKGWILTEGFITDWENTFTGGNDNARPIYPYFNGQGLYMYYVVSPTVIIFKEYTTEQVVTDSGAVTLYEPTLDSITDSIVKLANGTYVTELKISFTENALGTGTLFRITIHDGTNTICDVEVVDDANDYVYVPIAKTGVEHTVTVYATDGTNLSTGASDVNTPSGDSTTEQTASGEGITIGSDSIWGKDSSSGTTFYLDASTGDIYLGNTSGRHVSYIAGTGDLELTGTIRVNDIGTAPNITEYGLFATGDADFDYNTGLLEGTGVLIGSPGILGIKDGIGTFGLNAETGNVIFGHEDANRVKFNADTGVLESTGENRITDVIENNAVTNFGYFATGTAAYNTSTNVVSGSGIIMGSPGLFGVNNGNITFHLNPVTGQLWMASDSTIIGDGTTNQTSGNGTGIGYNSQRTADLAMKNTLDVNLIVETLNRALTLSVNGGADNSFEFKVS